MTFNAMKWIFPCSLLILTLFSCGDSNYIVGPKPKALGVPNQITVISEEDLWDGATGDSLRFYLESVYPVLPRPEPLFDVRYFTPLEITAEKLRRELRTFLICVSTQDTASRSYKMVKHHLGEDALSTDKISLKMTRDKWATDQIILYLIAPNEQALAASVSHYFPSITEQVNKHDRKQIYSKTYLQGKSDQVIKRVSEVFGINMDVPRDFQIALEEEDMMWLRKDFEDITVNLLIKRLAYTDQDQFTKDQIKMIRDKIGHDYVSSTSDSSYMVTNDEDLPMYVFQRAVNGNFAMEARGIWEMENDFMGGPFLSYLIQLPSKNELLFVDGFVLAPGQKKRNIMQEIELIIHSIR
jgi:hypothetical protein